MKSNHNQQRPERTVAAKIDIRCNGDVVEMIQLEEGETFEYEVDGDDYEMEVVGFE